MNKPVSLFAAALAATFAVSGAAFANERQTCLNNCTQSGAATSKQCQLDYRNKMNDCAKLATNEERNACKKQASETLRSCEAAARDEVKACKAKCPQK